LVQAADGAFYGTTGGGGANKQGTIFKITTGGTLTTLHNFNEGISYAPLIQAADGNLYGTTSGVIFKITTGGALTTLYPLNYANLYTALYCTYSSRRRELLRDH
jgi:uncharacterized repeat protein (TIGR03803 family)